MRAPAGLGSGRARSVDQRACEGDEEGAQGFEWLAKVGELDVGLGEDVGVNVW